MAAVDYFLKIDGIEGESSDDKHRGEIDIESFSWGATSSGSAAHGSGAGAGKVSMQDFHFVMHFNKASPKLLLATASGEFLKYAILSARKAGGRQQADYLTWTLSNCLVTSYETGANSVAVTESVGSTDEPSPEVTAVRNATSGAPADAFSINFSKIEVSYQVQNADGTVGTATTTGWDLATNTKV
ncbi:MAG: type VI secretion system tube protein Hcp [Chloroflexota bacterium]|nr:type VI secretion system tube protein Hcp [Chloroflexota bacterium]